MTAGRNPRGLTLPLTPLDVSPNLKQTRKESRSGLDCTALRSATCLCNGARENRMLAIRLQTCAQYRWKTRSGSMSRRVFYEVGWTDSWTFRRCCHIHDSLIDAAKCGMPRSALMFTHRFGVHCSLEELR